MISRLQQFLLSLTLLVLPFQLGKHFWPSFSYVGGIRVDYLSPTIYISDVCIFLLFIFSLTFLLRHCERPKGVRQSLSRLLRCFTPRNDLGVFGFFGGILFLSLGIFFSQSPFAGWYMLCKFFELFFFGWYVAHAEKIENKLFWAFSSGVFIEGILGILQFIHQRSLNSLWYFLGERSFSASTPGIANATIHGQLVLRPYATFPHPNVFAGYLVLALLFFLINGFIAKKRLHKIISVAILIFGFGVLLLTLSRVAIVVFILLSLAFLLFKLFKRNQKISCLPAIALATVGFLFLVFFLSNSLLSGRFLDLQGYAESLGLRDILMQSAWSMFVSHPILGVGLGNFLPSLPQYISSKVLFAFVQPVHNIFLLVLAETGIIGLGIFLWLLLQAFHSAWKKRYQPLFQFALISLIAMCLISITDHYFLTLQQGQLLFALVLGLCFSPKLLK